MNWQQKLADKTIGIKNLDRNTANLELNIDSLQDLFGGEELVYTINREIIVSAPQPVNVRLVDGMNYLSGDFICETSFIQLSNAIQTKAGDTALIVNGKETTLAEQRPFTASANWGVAVGIDTLDIGGDVWTISAISGYDWLNNEPSYFRLTLRK